MAPSRLSTPFPSQLLTRPGLGKAYVHVMYMHVIVTNGGRSYMHEACMGLLFGKVKARHLQVEPDSHLLGPYSLALLPSTAPAPVGLTQPPDSARARVRPPRVCFRRPRGASLPCFYGQLLPGLPAPCRALHRLFPVFSSRSAMDGFVPARPRAPARQRLPCLGLLASSQPPSFIPARPRSFLAPQAMHVFCMAVYAASDPVPICCRCPGSSALLPTADLSFSLVRPRPQIPSALDCPFGLVRPQPQLPSAMQSPEALVPISM